MNSTSTDTTATAGESALRGALRSRWLLPSIAAALLLLLAIGIPGHHLHIDEAWIGEQAYFLHHDGHVRSDFFEGFAGHEHRTVVYHRLFVLLGSWGVALFGWSLGALRAVTILSGALLLAAIAWHMRREMRAAWSIVAMAIALFLLMPLNFTYMKVFRPEILVALCGFAGYHFLWRYHRAGRRSDLAAAAVAGSLATLAHPYGVIFPICALLMLLRMRAWKGIGLFIAIGLLPAIPYIHDIATHYDLFHAQISNPLVAEKTGFTPLSPLFNLLDEHKRLFRKPEIILPTMLFILSLAVGFRRSAGERRFRQIHTILLVLLLGAAAQDKITRYAIPLLPFFAIEIAATLGEWIERPMGNRAWRWGMALAMALFIGFGVHAVATDLGSPREDVAGLNARIAAAIPPGTRCLAPMNFIFDQIGRYPIVALRYANLERNNALTMAQAMEFADRHHTDAIILNRYATQEEGIIDVTTARHQLDGRFRVAARTPEYMVLLRGSGPGSGMVGPGSGR